MSLRTVPGDQLIVAFLRLGKVTDKVYNIQVLFFVSYDIFLYFPLTIPGILTVFNELHNLTFDT